MKELNEAQVRSYRNDGYLFPVPVLSAEEAAECLRNLERTERRIGARLTEAEKRFRLGSYTYLPWVDRLVRHPRVLDVIEDIIGPDILVFQATFFIKEPGSPTFAAWHQDATYFGLQPYDHLTAWIALSDATREAGCMDVISFNGAPRQLHHAAARLENSINGAGQIIVEPLDETKAEAMQLKAGEMSLHNTLCPHRSAPNEASYRRVGIGISYIPAHVRAVGSYRMPALLVRGSNRFNNFDLLRAPTEEFSAEGLAANEAMYKRFYENYTEQLQEHEARFGRASVKESGAYA